MTNRYQKLNLFLELYQNAQLPNCYLNVTYKDENVLIENNTPNDRSYLVYSHSLSPDYLKYSVNKTKFKIHKIKQANKGYAVDLSEASNLHSYMQIRMSRSFRKTVRQSVQRIENTFRISYRMYFDDISKEEYNKLFDCLGEMLTKRFAQKKIKNYNLHLWSQIKYDFYNSLKNKKACVFVIYDSGNPIDISLNYLSNNIFFSWISSYNIDYAKFGLGHVDLFKHLEWCFTNNYKILELGFGDHDYKKKWCNKIYNFEHQIVYSRHSIWGIIFGRMECFKIQIKEFLKHKGINEYLKYLNKRS